MAEEKQESAPTEEEVAAKHYNEIMVRVIDCSKPFESEILQLCEDLAHVRALNAEAVEVIQDSRKVQVSLAEVLDAERKKRIVAEAHANDVAATARLVISECKAVTDQQKKDTAELREMKAELESAAVEVDEAREDQKAEVACERLRRIAAEGTIEHKVSPMIDRLTKLVATWRGYANGRPTDNDPSDAKGWIRLLAQQLENTINE
jgi:hypothetical protein